MNTLILAGLFLLALVLGLMQWRKARRGPGGDCGCPEERTDTPRDPPTEETGDTEGDDTPEQEKKPEIPPVKMADANFAIKPYLQLGTKFSASEPTMEVIWNAPHEDNAKWTLTFHSNDTNGVAHKEDATMTALEIPELTPVPAHKQYRALISGLRHGEGFTYDVLKDGQVVFTSSAMMMKTRSQRTRFVAVGDLGENSAGQAKVAYQISRYKPDLVVVPGDMAYKRGRVSENIEKFFPLMNSDETSATAGAPLMRSILFAACPGNHDFGRPTLADVPSLDQYPDLFGYFVHWSQPLKRPFVGATARNMQVLYGAEARCQAFLHAADGRYPRMSSFSFEYGDAHWLFLDANEHMDWNSQDLRDWVRSDLQLASTRWKFVVFHQPAFTSHLRHKMEERMRLLADIFQEHHVDVVFMGHAHWYERLYPLKFTFQRMNPPYGVEGEIELDRKFDGMVNMRPKYPLYLVTGAGGAKLHPEGVPTTPEPFTYKLVVDRHSFTVVDMDATMLTFRQISEDGVEIDRFSITK